VPGSTQRYGAFLSLDIFPLSCCPQLSFPIFAQFAYCRIVIYHPSAFEAPGVAWNGQMLLNELNLSDMMNALVKRLEVVPVVADSSNLDKICWACYTVLSEY
jgi:hypothetical protein